MTDPINFEVPLSQLAPDEKAKRAGSFGGVAALYERYRPGPSPAAVEWILPADVGTVVDLGAGTGALSRLLLDRVRDVIAVEPDDRMRSILTEQVPGVRALKGRGESMPLPDRSVDAVVASSSWHWMDPVATLHEVGRILVRSGTLGAVWSGPDPEGPFLVQAQALLAAQTPADDTAGTEIGDVILGDARRPLPTLEIPDDVPFDQPEHEVFKWDIALNADELIGLLGTLSSIITLPEERRQRVFDEARRLLRELLGVEGDVTVDVAFRADAWRSCRYA
ncbi:MAG TPA: class I SAM-dependent methyltransferase [Acidimicrobiales bacterium]|nr:class I SAM-dependent methyltransferase [Acidimicrobiales bacterium]